ncbi:hypothetical protein PN441_16095 [Spirulina major CS-329]|jgi:hypothetical protein|nr:MULTISPECIES: hypothetical protein [Spirulina]MDB9495107.1 hypothetical protein [Spirulina subsalsa CS-330]MDB9504600.1 hypothetical protein [Spirulina major CS-329]
MKRYLPDIKTILEFAAIWATLVSYSTVIGAIAAPLIILYFLYPNQSKPR